MQHVHNHNDHHHHDHSHDHDHDHEHSDLMEWVKAVILLGLSMYFVYNLISGNVTNYINIRFVWLSYVAGAMFLAYGLYLLYTLIQARRGQPVHHDHDHDHDHEHASWGVLAIVAIPVLIGFFSTSAPLDYNAVNGGVSLNAVGGEGGMTISSDDPMEWHVLDWLRAFDQSEDMAEFAGSDANLIGFIYREPDFDESTAMITRFTVNCCVADATAIGVPVRGDTVRDLEQGVWVRVNGEFALDNFRGADVPILNPATITRIEAPEQPYIYP